MFSYDLTLLTDRRYYNPLELTPYIQNVLKEDELLRNALEKRGLRINRTFWDNPDYDWKSTRFAMFRTTWDYFERFPEFSEWLDRTSKLTGFINPIELIHWNLDKNYLDELRQKGINIPNTVFIKKGDQRDLNEIVQQSGWQELILKPAVSGASRHTYRFMAEETALYESLYSELIAEESMLLQEFQKNVLSMGEVAFMVFGGKYSHAVLKKAKPGDFRVQDDFGGSVHHYTASKDEIAFVEKVMSIVNPAPVYARVDMIWDNNSEFSVSELEMIEPELWLRKDTNAAEMLADQLYKSYFQL
jgi:glutathione synthase/RimK-type ligase-like ATP-grasp enzyme